MQASRAAIGSPFDNGRRIRLVGPKAVLLRIRYACVLPCARNFLASRLGDVRAPLTRRDSAVLRTGMHETIERELHSTEKRLPIVTPDRVA